MLYLKTKFVHCEQDENRTVTLILRDMKVIEKSHNMNCSQSLYTVHSVGLYIVVNVTKLGIAMIWDKQTRVKIELNPKWMVSSFLFL